jgi:hypothetical protein
MRSTLVVQRGRRAGIRVDPERVRSARLAARLSLSDVAGDNLSRTMVHFVETGRARPSRDVLRLIARRTGKPMSYFVVDDPPESEGDAASLSLEQRLLSAGAYVRRFAETHKLTQSELAAMTLAEVSIRQAAVLAASLAKRPMRSSGSRRTIGNNR